MNNDGQLPIIPVLPTSDMARDLQWYQSQLGFQPIFGDGHYHGLSRGTWEIHLQWHADTDDDPLLGGSVIKLFVSDIGPFFQEMVKRATVTQDALKMHTPWGTHEFGCYDPNGNAIFIVQDVKSPQ